ncbi:aminomethyltransferase, mitochondrial-like [Artemia franciscana]|uniref:Aminomethyltransferase n=1 Tax=Artemia franciscana TaxID=6661 RepID=A0AA88ICN8_ARTSF|nr:hypothetical protein QYM36_001269 [Artemia franciscana]CAG4635429.1 EOG090X057R [Artemia franciscana]
MMRLYSIFKTPSPLTLVRTFASTEGIRKTCLFDFHLEHGGKMVEFAGYKLPVQYNGVSISESHKHTRTYCSLFDVSHMLQTKISGNNRYDLLESLTVADIRGLAENHGTLTVYTNENGGILDDLIAMNTSDGYLFVVSNAGCRDADLQLLKDAELKMKNEAKDVQVAVEDNALLALQGPTMVQALQPLVDIDLSLLYFMTTSRATIKGIPCRISRCGYTGEDGVEISLPQESANDIAQEILASKGNCKLAGLGARDSLRLEAGLCLYGNDISEKTTPVEASLTWLVAKERRKRADFPGASTILDQIQNKPEMKRVGFLWRGMPARSHTCIYSENGQLIGELTSGCPAPSVDANVAMGYVNMKYSKIGTPVQFEVRKKHVSAVVSKMPFVSAKYYVKK